MTINRRAVLKCAGVLSARVLVAGRLPAVTTGPRAAPGALDLTLSALSSGILRISISPANEQAMFSELGVLSRSDTKLAGPGQVRPAVVNWGKYSVNISDSPLHVGAYENGKLRQEIRFDLDSADVRFNLTGPVFGLGEGVHPYDRRGTQDNMINGQHSPDLETFGARLPIPWVISPEGWGVFIGQPSGSMTFSQTEARFRGSEATSTRNVYLLLGDTPADVLQSYAELTGYPQLPPLWAFGYQQSHRTLKDKDEILGIVKTFREKKLPCDAVIYLGTGFCPSGWNTGHGSFTFNENVFPDPAKVIELIHQEHFKVILHVVPPGNFHGNVADNGVVSEAPGDAAKYWPRHTALAKLGVDGWWPDEGDRLSVYSRLDRNKMYFEGSRKDDPARRPFALHRNGYAGLQRYGWLWSGDTFSTWKALQAQIMEGINIGLSGIPYWGTDTGGFVPTPEYSPELFARWFQFSAFCPSFRSHGRSWKLHLPWGWNLGVPGPKEVEGEWVDAWPPEADLHRPDIEEICRKYLELRYRLLPYIYSTAAQSHQTGIPMIRALWLAYPQDETAALVDDAYLWGENFLIAPVYEKGANERAVYLPHGDWWNFWSSERVEGGRKITVTAPLDTLPIFVKAGAVVPIDPIRQYTSEPVDSPTTLEIFPGADGMFRWYDDDHASFQYEQGNYMRVLCEWNDSERTLRLMRDPKGKQGAGRKLQAKLAGSREARPITLSDISTQVKF
jgi:alpha-glucosidase (family GH31 glycosyl hydrolase)